MIEQIRSRLLYTLQGTECAPPPEKAEALRALLQEDGAFSDLAYEEADPYKWSWGTHLGRLAVLAAGQQANDPETCSLLLHGLNVFLRQPRENPNWWHNRIGLPTSAAKFLLLMGEAMDAEQREGLLSYVRNGSMAVHDDLHAMAGANLLWVVQITLMHAVIENDLDLARGALATADRKMRIEPPGREGIQSDYSFSQHGTQFYSCGYGRSFMTMCAELVYALGGTDLQLSQDALSVFGFFVIYGIRACIRNRTADYLTVGRELARPEGLDADSVRVALLLLLKVEEMPCRDVMEQFLASMSAEGYALQGNRYFDQANYYVSRRPTAHLSCRGTSPDRALGESIIGENMLSANLYAGGATCVMVDGKEYERIFPIWDFSHVPGTTAPEESDEQIAAKLSHWHGVCGANTYCGGVSHNDFGLMYQDLNFAGVTGVIARFFINDVMIALGADLRCDADAPITTTLNQCRQYDELLTEQDGLPANSAYQGRVAYASLDGQAIRFKSEQRRGSWSRISRPTRSEESGRVCTLWIDHGVRPDGGSYAYAVIPAVSAAGSADRIKEITQKVTILRNDAAVQAIRYGDRVLSVFHQSGTLQLATYDQLISSAHSAHIL